MIKKSKLSDHIFKKGRFINPMNEAMGDRLVLLLGLKIDFHNTCDCNVLEMRVQDDG